MEKKKIIVLCSFVTGLLLLFFAIFFVVAHFTFQYFESEKVFQKSGLSITLTNDFHEREVLEYTAYYYSGNLAVYALKVGFNEFDFDKWNPYEKTCHDYAEAISNSYKELYPSTTEIITNDEITYFTFDFEKSGRIYKNLLAIYKANDAYWQVCFGSEKSNFENLQNDMIAYAKSVSVGD